MESARSRLHREKLTIARLMENCGAIPSSHDYHFNQFIWEHFPGVPVLVIWIHNKYPMTYPAYPLQMWLHLVSMMLQRQKLTMPFCNTLALGSFRIGIHIAAPALGIDPESELDRIAAMRLSTVYLPGNKITMLPGAAINHFTLAETNYARCFLYILMYR